MPDQHTTIGALRRLVAHLPASEEDYLPREQPDAAVSWRWPDRLDVLVAAGERPRLLLHGSIGVGKTTELHRWARILGDRAKMVTVEASADLLRTLGELAKDQDRILLVDGLDLLPEGKLPNLRPGTPLARADLPPMVYVVPHALMAADSVEVRDPRFTTAHLFPFPVRNAVGEASPDVVAWLAEGLRRRLGAVEVDDALLERAALASGGIPRDAVRIVRTALLAALGKPEVDLRAINEGIRELRQDLEQSLTPAERDWAANGYSGGTMNMSDLIAKNAVLVYEGDDRRYRLRHPLLDGTL